MVKESRKDGQPDVLEEHGFLSGTGAYEPDSSDTWSAEEEEAYQAYCEQVQEEYWAREYEAEARRYAEYVEWCRMVDDEEGKYGI